MTNDDVHDLISPLPLAEKLALLEAIMQAAGKLVAPRTAEIWTTYGQTLDPYGVGGLGPEQEQVGRISFAQAPNGLWVWFGHLPPDIRASLESRRRLEKIEPYSS